MGFIKTNNKTYTLNDKINDINRDIGESYLQDQISNIDVNSINELKLNLNNESESRINSDLNLRKDLDDEVDIRIKSDLELTNALLTKTDDLKNELENINHKLVSGDQGILDELKIEQENTKNLLKKIKELNEDLEIEVIDRINKDIELKKNQKSNTESINSLENVSEQFNQNLNKLIDTIDGMNKKINQNNTKLNYRIDYMNSSIYELFKSLSNDPRCKPYTEHLLVYLNSIKKYDKSEYDILHLDNHKHNSVNSHVNNEYEYDNQAKSGTIKNIESNLNEENDIDANHINNNTKPIKHRNKSHPTYYHYHHGDKYSSNSNHDLKSDLSNKSISIYSENTYVNGENLIDKNNYAEFYRVLNSSKDKYKYNKLLI